MNSLKFLKIGLILTTLGMPTYTLATTQTVSTNQSEYVVNAGDSFDVSLNYTSDSDDLTGLGVSLVFDSEKLAFESFSASLQQNLLAADVSAKSDQTDLDKETSTDSVVTIAWASVSGGWPGQTTSPLTVARFKALQSITSDTVINITGNAAGNSTLVAEPIAVRIAAKDITQPSSQLSAQASSSSSNASSTGGGGVLTGYLLALLLLLRMFRVFVTNRVAH